MKRLFRSPKPQGSSQFDFWMKEVDKACNEILPIVDGDNYKVERTTTGQRLVFTTRGGGGKNTVSGFFRGVWTDTPDAPYMVQHMVVIQTGPSAGTYISVTDNNDNEPSTGIDWVQIAPGNTIGTWS